jgi:hypothetical protein
MNVLHTIVPGATINEGYFDEDTISFIQGKVSEIIRREYIQYVFMSREDVIKVMASVLQQRRESVPKMCQRTIMFLVNDFLNHQIDTNKRLNWEQGYSQSQSLMDNIGQTSKFDSRGIKTNDKKKYNNQSLVGGTLRFYFT